MLSPNSRPNEHHIKQAFETLALGDSRAARSAFEYLHALSPDPQGQVVSVVLGALRSDYDIVRKTALTLLGTIGRHHPEVIPNLRAVAQDHAQDFHLRHHALGALSRLRTTSAAECVLSLLAEYIRDGQDALSYSVVENLRKSPIDLIPLQSTIVDIASTLPPSHVLRLQLETLHASITQAGHKCLRNFIDAERLNTLSVDLESLDSLTATRPRQFGDIKVLFDGMIPFLRSDKTNEFEEDGDDSETNPFEQARAVFLSKENGEVVVVGVTDIRSSPWLIKSGETFANSSWDFLFSQAVVDSSAQERFSIFRPPTPLHPAGYFEKADVEDRFDGTDAWQWSGEKEFSSWAGPNCEEIKRYLSDGKPLDPEFMLYLRLLIEDELMVTRHHDRQHGQDR
jgi:hypothetical protein